MPQIHVCPLSQVAETVARTGARSLLSVITHGMPATRPASIPPERHKVIAVSDITSARDGHILPAAAHVEDLLAFARDWDRDRPMVIHCFAGVSRSTAAAYVVACQAGAPGCEADLARVLRERSPTATPNALMVGLADTLLGRGGRMVAAIAAIGRGADCYEGVPFALDLPSSSQKGRAA